MTAKCIRKSAQTSSAQGSSSTAKIFPDTAPGKILRSKVKRGLGSRRSLGSRCALGCGALGGRWRGLRRTGRGRGLRCGSRRVHDGRVVLYRG